MYVNYQLIKDISTSAYFEKWTDSNSADFKLSPISEPEQTQCYKTSAYKIQTPGNYPEAVAYRGILFGGGQRIQLRTEDTENRDLGAVAP